MEETSDDKGIKVPYIEERAVKIDEKFRTLDGSL
jgi:hypothetical protein